MVLDRRRVVPVVLEDSEEHQAALDAALADKGAIELVRKFIGDASCRSVFSNCLSSILVKHYNVFWC